MLTAALLCVVVAGDARCEPALAYYDVVGRLAAGLDDGGNVEIDPRETAPHTLRRLALLGGRFPPAYLPVSAQEITDLLLASRAGGGEGLQSERERAAAAGLLQRYGLGHDGWHRGTCECKVNPLHLRLTGRAGLTWREVGGRIGGEAGLGAAGGLSADVAPELAIWTGRWWIAVSPRLAGHISGSGSEVAGVLRHRGWPLPTGLPDEGSWRSGAPPWSLDWPRWVAGVRLGRWAVTLGATPIAVGPGLRGGLTAGVDAPAYPAATVRRTAPFHWPGALRWIAPSEALVRVGRLDEQTVTYRENGSARTRRAHPLLAQWFVTWQHRPWLRSSLTQVALAAPREGRTLTGDLPEILFPLPGTTWSEPRNGPVTDRILTYTLEARFRRAPWPLLPAAGRVWVEYGGEDINEHGWLPLPQLSVPAAVLGCELVEPAWDLAVEFAETRHPDVLWYANAGFLAGDTHDGMLLGLPQGGGAERWLAVARWRPTRRGDEFSFAIQRTVWRAPGRDDEVWRRELEIRWNPPRTAGGPEIRVGHTREEYTDAAGSGRHTNFMSVRCLLTI